MTNPFSDVKPSTISRDSDGEYFTVPSYLQSITRLLLHGGATDQAIALALRLYNTGDLQVPFVDIIGTGASDQITVQDVLKAAKQ